MSRRRSKVYDCWGQPHRSRSVRRNGSRVYLPARLDHPVEVEQMQEDPARTSDARRDHERTAALQALQHSARFTQTEMRTLSALVVDGLSLSEIARAEGCSRQAIVARLVGSTAGHTKGTGCHGDRDLRHPPPRAPAARPPTAPPTGFRSAVPEYDGLIELQRPQSRATTAGTPDHRPPRANSVDEVQTASARSRKLDQRQRGGTMKVKVIALYPF